MTKLIVKADIYPKCSNYLKIIARNDAKMTLEEYIDSCCKKQKSFHFTHDQLNECRFIYRDKEYSYSELCDNKIAETQLPIFYNDKIFRLELFGCGSVDLGYKIRLIETLDRYLNKARFEALKSAIILDVNFMNADYNRKSYIWQYIQRCQYAENAIYSYYAVFEILMLIIWIDKEYHNGKNVSSFMDVCKSCKLCELFNKLKTDDLSMLDLFADVMPDGKIAVKPMFEKVREWCNKFKHRGILRFEGEEKANYPILRFEPTNEGVEKGFVPFSSNDYKYSYIDLDNDVIPALLTFQNEFIDVARQIFSKMQI